MKKVLLLTTLIFASGCSGLNLHIKDTNPYKSSVKLSKQVYTVVCKENGELRECVELRPTEFNASGTIVAENKEHSFIMTAGHFCQNTKDSPDKIDSIFNSNMIPPEARSYFDDATFISTTIITDYLGQPYFARLVAYEIEDTDLCLMITDRKMNFRPIPVSEENPKLGDRLYMASAPMGIHYPGSIIILDGFYSGFLWHPFFNKPTYSVTDFPLLPGSSGAGILNEKGEIVSAAFATNMGFPFDSFGVPRNQIEGFLNKHLDMAPRNKFREWLNRMFD